MPLYKHVDQLTTRYTITAICLVAASAAVILNAQYECNCLHLKGEVCLLCLFRKFVSTPTPSYTLSVVNGL